MIVKTTVTLILRLKIIKIKMQDYNIKICNVDNNNFQSA
jgi:hypothetical protein